MIIKLSYAKGGARYIHIDDVKHMNGCLSIVETRCNEYSTHESVSCVTYNRAELMTDELKLIAVYEHGGGWYERC